MNLRHQAAASTRRAFLVAAATALAAVALPQIVLPARADDAAQQIADHFSSVKTMMGDFVQFGPSGEQSGGKFYIERPGKIRFDYDPPAKFKVTSDGKSVVLENDKLHTADLYSLSETPLKLLLDDHIDLTGNKVQDIKQDPDLTTITLADKSLFGKATITMMFDPKSYDLKQWTIRDAQGRDTTVMIYNVKEGVTFDPSVFKINYNQVHEMNQMKRGG